MTKEFQRNNVDFDELAKEFWKKNRFRLKSTFLDKLTTDDIIITASPRFLMEQIQPFLKTTHIICSEFDTDKGEFEFACYQENKVYALKKLYPDTIINSFYTDSMNDSPLMKIANKSFLVKKNKISIIKKIR